MIEKLENIGDEWNTLTKINELVEHLNKLEDMLEIILKVLAVNADKEFEEELKKWGINHAD